MEMEKGVWLRVVEPSTPLIRADKVVEVRTFNGRVEVRLEGETNFRTVHRSDLEGVVAFAAVFKALNLGSQA